MVITAVVAWGYRDAVADLEVSEAEEVIRNELIVKYEAARKADLEFLRQMREAQDLRLEAMDRRIDEANAKFWVLGNRTESEIKANPKVYSTEMPQSGFELWMEIRQEVMNAGGAKK